MQGADVILARRSMDAAGNVVMEGCVLRGTTQEVLNVGTVVIQPGEAVRHSIVAADRSTLGRWDQGTAEPIKPNVLRGIRGSGAGNSGNWIGIALEAIRPGNSGEVACIGSYVMAIHDGFSGAAAGDVVIDSAFTAGAVSTQNTYPATVNRILGDVVIPNGTGVGQSGSDTQVGIRVNPR